EGLMEMAEHLDTLRAVKPPVVVQPAPHHRVGESRQILQALVIPGGRHPPTADGLADPLGGLGTDRRQETNKKVSPPVLRSSGVEGIAEEIELDIFVFLRPVIILAVNDLGLRCMKLQTALCKACPDGIQHRLRLPLTPAVHDSIVSEPLERIVRKGPLHPHIEAIMQVEIRQERAYNTTLRSAFCPLKEGAIRTFDRRAQPPANVQTDPGKISVVRHGFFD